jgi:hypothetical protein
MELGRILLGLTMEIPPLTRRPCPVTSVPQMPTYVPSLTKKLSFVFETLVEMSSGFELPRLLAGRAMVKQILRWPAGEHVERGCRSGFLKIKKNLRNDGGIS